MRLSYVSTARVASYGPRFLSTVRFVKIGQLAKIFWANGLPPPLAKKFPYAYELMKSSASEPGLSLSSARDKK